MLKTTLLPLSLNESRQRLADMAGFITYFKTEKVYLCHIMTGNDKKQKALYALQEIGSLFENEGIKAEPVIQKGNIAEKVCMLANDLNVDYLSLKWQKKNIIKRTILGSPDADILRLCDVPALIYKSSSYLEAGSQLKTVMYATDFQETDRKVIPYLSTALEGVETLYILHVRDRAPDPKTDAKRLEQIESKIKRIADQCLENYTSIQPLITTGSVRYQLPRRALSNKVDLIVIGKHDKKRTMEKIIGSTAESLPYWSYNPILIIS